MKLVNEVVEAADEKQLTKTIARYGPVDLLCIDELGTWTARPDPLFNGGQVGWASHPGAWIYTSTKLVNTYHFGN